MNKGHPSKKPPVQLLKGNSMENTESQEVELQLTRENEFKKLAEDRYKRKQEEGAGSNTTAGKNVTQQKDTIDLVADAIKALVYNVEHGKAGRGRPALAASYLRLLKPDPVAILTVRIGFDAAVKQHTMARAAMRLATSIFDHYQFDLLEQEAMGLVIHMEKKHKKRSAGSRKASIMRHAAKLAGVQPMEWAEGDRLKLGVKLLEIMTEETGLIKMEHVRTTAKRSKRIIDLTEETLAWYKRVNDQAVDYLAHDLRPTLIRPKPWTTPLSGAYYSDNLKRDIMRRTADATRDDLFAHDLTLVYDALNSIQNTEWSINNAVYDVMSAAYQEGSTIGGLPFMDDMPIPARPEGIDQKIPVKELGEEDAKLIVAWRRSAVKVHDENHSICSKRLAIGQQIAAAKELKGYDKFYFPYNLDFRGRIYPLPPVINPQSDDFGKSLLHFARGKRLGEAGSYWFHVHIANLFGIDKVSFDDRVQWTRDHWGQLIDSGINPLDGDRFWTEADSPWCALAACFEATGYQIMGHDYVSHMAVAMDGSCSGLQHFSAMLRDEQGGRAVNLTKTDVPSDVYVEVQKKVEQYLMEPDLETDQLCQAWRGNVTRKIVKRPCMTFAYSVTRQGIIQQVLDELHKERGEYALPGYDNHESARFIAPLIERAIRETVVRASEAMDWLKAVCKVLSDSELPISWYTPDGLPILQHKNKYTSKKHKVWFMGERIRLTLRTKSKKLDRAKQASSIAPNFVHSMDGCHLRMVVNRMVTEGITKDFSMIHDSFGVHACDVDELNYVIRDEFVQMYSEDVLHELREQVLSHLPVEEHDKVPEIPAPGTLDLESVMEADFFFA